MSAPQFQKLQQMISPFSEQKILVVDDAALNRELLTTYLLNAGFKNIQTAEDGIDALEKVKQFEPDLVILDLIMPRMDGMDVIKNLRANPKYAQLPIIVQTSISDPEQRVDAWSYGATDVVTKPIHKLELLSRVRVQLENSYLIRELETYQTVASDDIAQALEVQRSLLPGTTLMKTIAERRNLSFDSLFIPSRFLSGDMWGAVETENPEFAIWICDFAGKGIRASLNTFRLHTLIQELKGHWLNPGQMIHSLNRRMTKMMQPGQFATFFYGVIDPINDKIHYTAASSTYPILYYPEEQRVVCGEAAGIPLGVVNDADYPVHVLDFPKGASLILYSDMFWEDKGIPGISFLPEKLEGLVKELNGRPFLDVVREQLSLVGDLSLPDDLTLIEINRRKDTV